MTTAIEVASALFGSGVFTGAVAYAVRHVPVSLANARLTRAEATLKEKEAKKAEAEARRIDAERDRDWQNDTGKVLRDQRSDIERERGKAEAAHRAEHDCKEELKKLDAECKKRDEVHTARARAQAHEIKNVRAALNLVLASDATKSIPPAAVREAVELLAKDEKTVEAAAAAEEKTVEAAAAEEKKA